MKDVKNDTKIYYYQVRLFVFQLRLNQIHASTFTNNNATDGNGGALSLKNIKSMLIAGSNFVSNDADVKGGGIYYECEETTYNCKLEIRGTNTFSKNTAGESGGAIYWGQVEPKFTSLSDRQFSQNKALIYANDIGSFPAKMV